MWPETDQYEAHAAGTVVCYAKKQRTMTKGEKLFHEIADELPNATKGKIFGALGIKASNGKFAAILWKDEMFFKLNAHDEKEILKLSGARQATHLYAPDRKMKGWVAVPIAHADQWKDLAKKSFNMRKKTKY